MVYTPGTDFVALWRNQTTGAAKAEMPTLDLIMLALDRANLVDVSFTSTQPTANQATTMWFRPATPTYTGEGTLYLWDAATTAYVAATPKLFAKYLDAVKV